jgi:hypothetical protein
MTPLARRSRPLYKVPTNPPPGGMARSRSIAAVLTPKGGSSALGEKTSGV